MLQQVWSHRIRKLSFQRLPAKQDALPVKRTPFRKVSRHDERIRAILNQIHPRYESGVRRPPRFCVKKLSTWDLCKTRRKFLKHSKSTFSLLSQHIESLKAPWWLSQFRREIGEGICTPRNASTENGLRISRNLTKIQTLSKKELRRTQNQGITVATCFR